MKDLLKNGDYVGPVVAVDPHPRRAKHYGRGNELSQEFAKGLEAALGSLRLA
jgi:hypothetical protein